MAGEPGIGKSRLAGELLLEVADRATALVGRCLSYGQGITLWPLREMVREAAGDETREALDRLLHEKPDGPAVAERIAAALGLADVDRPADETAWAFRRLFEALARSRPHVLVVEDAHWAEPALLDLLEYVSQPSVDGPLLVLCLARPELFEARPAWATGAIELAPLSSEDAEALIDNLPGGRILSRDLRSRVVARAEGNPLFAEQFVALLAASDGEALPSHAPTIHAILAARLDRLGPGERAVAERAAVVGREFTVEAVAALLPPAAGSLAWRHLDALTRKMLVQPDRAVLPGNKGFRFQHALIHEAAYRRLPKALRAELHERFAGWLEDRAAARTLEFEEILGYHLEQAYRYRAELGPVNEQARTLASRAGKRLGAAGTARPRTLGSLRRRRPARTRGRAARARGRRAPARARRPRRGAQRGRSSFPAPRRSSRRRSGRRARPETNGSRRTHSSRAMTSAPEWIRRRRIDFSTRLGVQRAIKTFEEHGDERGLANAWLRAADLRSDGLRESDCVAAMRRALEHAERASDTQFQALSRLDLALRLDDTSAHLSEVRTVQEDNLAWAEATGSQRVRAASLALGARLAAREGRFDEARSLIEEAEALFGALGVEVAVTAVAVWTGEIEELADDLEIAERAYRAGLERAARAGDRLMLAAFAYSLGRVLDARGAQDEAEQLLVVAGDEAAQTATKTRSSGARRGLASIARRGQIEEAVRLAREAVVRAEASDNLHLRCSAVEDLVHVLRAAERPSEAIPLVKELVRLRERKGEPIAAAKARSLLEQLSATAVA